MILTFEPNRLKFIVYAAIIVERV